MPEMNIAVVGAGPAGLVTARELLRQGLKVTVFEAQGAVGGAWVYNDASEDDPLGQQSKHPIHSSLYRSLRTNIPRDLMAFRDYTFDSQGGGNDSWPRFPHHSSVLTYLQRFAENFDLSAHIQFNSPIRKIMKQGQEWLVTVGSETRTFDGVSVCSGHYALPRVPALADLKSFSGVQLHSHNYRDPAPFRNLRVALWGTSASGFDIANEIATVAAETHWLGNAFSQPVSLGTNRFAGPSPSGVDQSGRLVSGDHNIEVDVLMYCTGYRYEYPFLGNIIHSQDNQITPLYRDIVPPEHPSLGLIGLPFLVIPFPLFEMQAKWFAGQLTGTFSLPSQRAMTASIADRLASFEATGSPRRHFHRLGENQFNYYDELATDCGEPAVPGWFRETWADAQRIREKYPLDFRDQPFEVRGPTRCSSG